MKRGKLFLALAACACLVAAPFTAAKAEPYKGEY